MIATDVKLDNYFFGFSTSNGAQFLSGVFGVIRVAQSKGRQSILLFLIRIAGIIRELLLQVVL